MFATAATCLGMKHVSYKIKNKWRIWRVVGLAWLECLRSKFGNLHQDSPCMPEVGGGNATQRRLSTPQNRGHPAPRLVASKCATTRSRRHLPGPVLAFIGHQLRNHDKTLALSSLCTYAHTHLHSLDEYKRRQS